MARKYKKVKERIKAKPLTKEQLMIEPYTFQIIEEKQGDITVYIGDVRRALAKLPAESVDCVVTSPPYWRQRDYKVKEQIGQENSYFQYINRLVEAFNEMKRVLKPTGTFFLNVGYKYKDKELLLIPELLAAELQKNGWALLNKVIWEKANAMPSSLENRFSNVYEPVFLFVKKESKYQYYFSMDGLRTPVKNFFNNKKPEDLFGLEVNNSLFKNKVVEGQVKKVYEDGNNNMFVQVLWNNGKKNFELVNEFDQESQIDIDLVCQDCKKVIRQPIDVNKHINCKEFPKPIIPLRPSFNKTTEIKAPFLFQGISPLHSYNGKYRLNPESRGASPGARKSLFGEYLVSQRRYRIFQPIVADYLRFWRNKTGITTKEIDRLLGYKDTAGHWFRKDTGSWGRGGSIPLPDDWFRLKKILKFDSLYDRWITEIHLVLQTVKAHPKGRNPGDVWSIKIQHLSEAHFAIFPEELVKKCIEAGCPKNGVVLDPFAGSGTTGKVAQDLGRDAILIDIVPDYLTIIKKRCKKIKEMIYVD